MLGHSKTGRRYDWRRQLPDFRDRTANLPVVQGVPPASDLRSGFGPVYDQGDIGSCTANALCGLIGFVERKFPLAAGYVDPSRMYQYWQERVIDGDPQQDAGSSLRTACRAAAQGYCPEALWPYRGDLLFQSPSSRAVGAAGSHRVTAYLRIPQTIEALTASLHVGNPVAFGFSVFSEFESPQVAASGIVPMPQASEQMIGGHAVVLCGYDGKSFIVRNSWGSAWGRDGYFLMPAEYVLNPGLASDFWTVTKEI